MNKKISLPVLLAITFVLFAGCTEKNKNRSLNVDELLANAISLVGKTVIVEGRCTHVCTKSGMKLFLQGAGETKTLRAQSGATLGKFDPTAVDRKVRVRGKLTEVQIVENNPDAHATHGTEGESCKTEGAAEKSYYIETESYQIID